MSETATLIVTATPNPDEMPSVQEYLKGVMPLLMGAGGKLIKRAKVSQLIHGQQCGMVLVMDFESSADIENMFKSPEYAALVSVRDKGFTEMNIMIAGEM